MTISKPVHGLRFFGRPGDINPGSHSWKDTLCNHKFLEKVLISFSPSPLPPSQDQSNVFCSPPEVDVRADVLVLSVPREHSLLRLQLNLGKFPTRHPTSRLGFVMCLHHPAGLPKPNSSFSGMIKTLRPKSGFGVVTCLSGFWLSLGFGVDSFFMILSVLQCS